MSIHLAFRIRPALFDRTALDLLRLLLLLLLITLSFDSSAQRYKWIDANGKTVYSDTPPPANNAKLISKSTATSSTIPTTRLPDELKAAVNKNPVLLYTASNCEACNMARNFLKRQGIPFLEKTVQSLEEIEKLKQISGDTMLPLMTVNKSKFPGYDPSLWLDALLAGGYPEISILPKDYRYADPQALVPLMPQNRDAPPAKPVEQIQPRTASPTGIRF